MTQAKITDDVAPQAQAAANMSQVKITNDVAPQAQAILNPTDTIISLFTGRVMKKAYCQLCDRRRAAIDNSILGALTECWNYIAPGQNIDQLRS